MTRTEYVAGHSSDGTIFIIEASQARGLLPLAYSVYPNTLRRWFESFAERDGQTLVVPEASMRGTYLAACNLIQRMRGCGSPPPGIWYV